MGTKSKRHNQDFKQKAIKLALTSSQPIAITAKELGINHATLYSWVKKNKTKYIEKHGQEGIDVHEELARLRKENARLKEEREILKKAATFFAKASE